MAKRSLRILVLSLLLGTLWQAVRAEELVVEAAEPVRVQVPAPPANTPPAASPEAPPVGGGFGNESTDPAPLPPPEPEFDPESRDGSQRYDQVYTRDLTPPKPKPPLPRHRALVGDMNKDAVEVSIGKAWYRLPRSLFAKVPNLAPGEEVNVRMSRAQLEQYRMRRSPRANPGERPPGTPPQRPRQ